MRRLISFIFICLFLILLPLTASAASYRVLRIVDGDTIQILYKGKNEKVRLLCVDTPESVHPDREQNVPIGNVASKYTRKRLHRTVVNLEFDGMLRDRYGRLLAYVHIHNVNFNLELVREGLSPYYTEYGKSRKYDNEFRAAEAAAMNQRLGIWNDPDLTEKYLSLKSEWDRESMQRGSVYIRSRGRSIQGERRLIEPEEKPIKPENKSVWPEKKTWREKESTEPEKKTWGEKK